MGKCNGCQMICDATDLYETEEGQYLCSECLGEHCYLCNHCGKAVYKSKAHEFNGTFFCQDCFEKNKMKEDFKEVICSGCQMICDPEDLYRTEDGRYFCSE